MQDRGIRDKGMEFMGEFSLSVRPQSRPPAKPKAMGPLDYSKMFDILTMDRGVQHQFVPDAEYRFDNKNDVRVVRQLDWRVFDPPACLGDCEQNPTGALATRIVELYMWAFGATAHKDV